MVELLLAHGPMQTPGQHGYTPLHYAAEIGNKDIAELLLRMERSKCQEYFGDTPLHLAEKNGYKLWWNYCASTAS